MSSPAAPYLRPYLDASARHGDGFESLLWASPVTQARRFDAIVRLCPMADLDVLDVGCGRADLLDFLISRRQRPHYYTGLEAVPPLLDGARRKRHARCRLIRADFVAEPSCLDAGADAIIFSGSLNTLPSEAFYTTLAHAYGATGEWVVFNFLSSPQLACASWLTWHSRRAVMAFCGRLTPYVRHLDNYLAGDCTIAMRKVALSYDGPD